jgi:hypothetical protein
MVLRLPRATYRPPTGHEIETAQVLREGRLARERQATERRQRAAEELAQLEVADVPRR